MDNVFSSKILLFGEYSIIKGSQGLAIPFAHFSGELKQSNDETDLHDRLELDDLYEYFKGSGILSKVLDLKSFKNDLKERLYFDSNIPFGHGVGSSGALCASLYHRYAFDFERKDSYSSDELKYLQDLMALMESFYHGASSGFDCLISLINLPVLIEGRNNLKIVDLPDLNKFGHFYLYETGIVRKTAPLVHSFLNQYDNDEEFRDSFKKFQSLSNYCIQSVLDAKTLDFQNGFKELSKFQFLHFSSLIPDEVKHFWAKGLETDQYYVKICGAGGGGYFLVFSKESLSAQINQLIDLKSN